MGEDHFLNLQPGTIVNGRYEVVKCLGTGSMGMVYACRHRELAGHIVAMKVLFSEVARDEVAAARFRNEIVASYGVSHPNVVRAYEYFKDGDLVAYTMEFIGGGDLADRLSMNEPISFDEIVNMLVQMCAGVQSIHEAGIIHRDLKPENILLTAQGDIKITDFGIARTGTGPKLTEHGGVVGTIDYVSPEYLERGQVDARSDIYALGVLGYEMVTGESPFKGKSVIETMTMRLRTDPEPPSSLRPGCPQTLNDVILNAMARDPETRYQSANDMLDDLRHLVDDPSQFPALSGRQGDSGTVSTFNARASSAQPVVQKDPPSSPSLSEAPLTSPSAGASQVSGGHQSISAASGGAVQSGIAEAGVSHAGAGQVSVADTSPVGSYASAAVGESSIAEEDSAIHGQHLEADLDDSSVTSPGASQSAKESVLSTKSAETEDTTAGDSSGTMPSVTASGGHLSSERIKALTLDFSPSDDEDSIVNMFKTVLSWVFIILMGFAVGLLVLRHYDPELFGVSQSQLLGPEQKDSISSEEDGDVKQGKAGKGKETASEKQKTRKKKS